MGKGGKTLGKEGERELNRHGRRRAQGLHRLVPLLERLLFAAGWGCPGSWSSGC